MVAQFFLFLLLLSSTVAFAGKTGEVQVADIPVRGPGGEMMVYFRDGNDIVVRSCEGEYPNVKKRGDCQGKENRVPLEAFKRTIKSTFMIVDADKLKPLTEDEVKAYREGDPSKQQELERQKAELEAKLSAIEEFIKDAGGQDEKSKKDLADTKGLLEKVRAELNTNQKSGEAIKKVNALITQLVDKITSASFDGVSSAKDADKAFYNLLKQSYSARPECGTDYYLKNKREPEEKPKTGSSAAWLENFFIPNALAAQSSIDARIKDCSAFSDSTKKSSKNVEWNLVSRRRDAETGKYYEVWKDSKSGLIWGDTLDNRYTHYKAVDACSSSDGKRASAKITDKSFALPSKDEYVDAEKNGIRGILPNMKDRWFWSSSVLPQGSGYAFYFYGNDGYVYFDYRDNDNDSVRCVSR